MNLIHNSRIHLQRNVIQEAFLGHVISPYRFYIRLERYDTMLTKLVSDLQDYVSSYSNDGTHVFKKNDICVALYETDWLYYRARILSIDLDETTGKVMSYYCFFVDYGNYTNVTIDFVHPLTIKLIKQLPFQAIECCLDGITEISNEGILTDSNKILEDLFYDNADTELYLNLMYVRLMSVRRTLSNVVIYSEKPSLTENPSPVNDVINRFLSEKTYELEERDRIDQAGSSSGSNTKKDFSYLLDGLNFVDFGDSDTESDEWDVCFEPEDYLATKKKLEPNSKPDLMDYFMQLHVNNKNKTDKEKKDKKK